MGLLSELMDPREKITLQNCRNCFLEDLDPSSTFLSTLSCGGVLTEDQRDRIERKTTRQDKVVMLLDTLPRRGPRAFRKFVDILRKDYNWLSEKLCDELQIQEYSIRIQAAIEDKLKHTHEYLRNKETVSQVVTEVAVPVLLQEMRDTGRVPSSGDLDDLLREIINDQILPLLDGAGIKHRLDSAEQQVLATKISDLLEKLKNRTYCALGLADNEDCDTSLPNLIEKKLQDVQKEGEAVRRELRKTKKNEERVTSENQKLKTDNKNLKAELKKFKGDCSSSKIENKKLKDEVSKTKLANEKMKLEIKNLKEHLEKAGIDVRISTDFYEGQT